MKMDEAFNDPRFGHIMSDPKFKKPPKFQRKVKIDKRFQRMFNDKNFQVKYTVDKRGKPVNQSSVENYGKFYALSDDDDSDSDDTENNTDNQSSDSSVEEQKTVKQVDKTKKLKLKSSLRENKKILVKSKKDSNKMKDCEQNLEENSKNKSKTKKKGLVEDETVDDAGNNDFDEDEEEEEDDEREDKEEEDSDYDNDRETEETSDESEDDIPKEVKEEALKKVSQKRKLPQEVKDKLHDMSVDYARGMGVLSDSSSSDDSSEDDAAADEEEDLEHDWGELDKDAERTDSATSRLAICNMDWDRIRAVDLMVLCSSFLPPGGVIESVSIYISEFGRKRMEEEEVRGPIEIVEQKRLESEIDLENREEEDEEGDKYQMEQLRKYQLLRLKYYYAIVVCDSADTASTLYDECDGLEYESSATRVDLRFVPDDVTFDEEPRDVCTKLPDVKKYQPRLFLNTALQQGKVECTWDETDPERVKLAQKLHQLKGGDNIDDKELQMFLASSEEEVEQNEEHEAGKEVTNGDGKDSDDSNSEESDISDNDGKVKKNSIDKYRSLLAKIQEEDEKKKNRDVEMEITWGVGLKEKAQKMVDKKLKENIQMTPFEKMIEKKREKKKLKKKERIKRNGEDSTNDDIDEDSSDDDIPDGIDMNDEYFREELEGFAPKKSKNKKKKDKQKSDSDDGEDDEETKRNANELDLLFMDENGGETQKKHFNLKKIMENEDDSKKKKKRKGRKQLIKKNKKKVEAPATYVEDDFKINVADERFSALYSSHHFNIDPADAHYKKTKGMEAFIHEKLSRKDKDERSGSSSLGKKTRDNVKSSNKDGLHSNPTKKQKLDSTSDLSQIVNSIKRNTQFSKTKTKS